MFNFQNSINIYCNFCKLLNSNKTACAESSPAAGPLWRQDLDEVEGVGQAAQLHGAQGLQGDVVRPAVVRDVVQCAVGHHDLPAVGCAQGGAAVSAARTGLTRGTRPRVACP